MSDEKTLLDLRKKVDDAKNEAARLEGSLNEMTRRLKEDFGVDDLKEAKILLKKKKSEMEKMDAEFKEKLDELLSLLGDDR